MASVKISGIGFSTGLSLHKLLIIIENREKELSQLKNILPLNYYFSHYPVLEREFRRVKKLGEIASPSKVASGLASFICVLLAEIENSHQQQYKNYCQKIIDSVVSFLPKFTSEIQITALKKLYPRIIPYLEEVQVLKKEKLESTAWAIEIVEKFAKSDNKQSPVPSAPSLQQIEGLANAKSAAPVLQTPSAPPLQQKESVPQYKANFPDSKLYSSVSQSFSTNEVEGQPQSAPIAYVPPVETQIEGASSSTVQIQQLLSIVPHEVEGASPAENAQANPINENSEEDLMIALASLPAPPGGAPVIVEDAKIPRTEKVQSKKLVVKP